MTNTSLRNIEKALADLWKNRTIREHFLRSKESKIDKKGVQIYAQLLSRSNYELMSLVYPLCAKLIGERWEQLVDNYVQRYPRTHFYVGRLAKNFAEYLSRYGQRYTKKHPFITELADFEWLQLELAEMDITIETVPYKPLHTPDEWANWQPMVNPVIILRKYGYPIPDILESLKDNVRLPKDMATVETHIAAYREPVTHLCKYLQLGKMAMHVIEMAHDDTKSYQDLLTIVVNYTGMDTQQCTTNFFKLVDTLQSQQVFIGSQSMLNQRQAR